MATVGQVITQAQGEFESKRVRKTPEEVAPAEAPVAAVCTGRGRSASDGIEIPGGRKFFRHCHQLSTFNNQHL
jgi:hypothetical protein